MKLFLWGTGHIANEVLKKYNIFEKYDIVGFIDNDPYKQGRKIYGKYIYAPNILTIIKVDKIIILTIKYEEIYQQICRDLNLGNIEVEDWKYFERQFDIKTMLIKRYKDTDDLEIKGVLEYIKQNELEVFNYSFIEKYKNIKFSILYDQDCEMFYVMHQGKKMYFAKSLNTKHAVAAYYRGILLEQDRDSPHKYLDEEFTVCCGDVVVDAGTAEGNFALDIIDRVSKVYLIESDNEWIEALNETFKDYKDKVVIINKYLTSLNDGMKATIDYLIEEPINFIKIDIEGNEWDALLGADKLIRKSKRIRCAVCSYHAEYDETIIKSVLMKYGLQCTTTHGYMWFPSWGRDGNRSTKLCRGIVRGVKGVCQDNI